MDETGITLSVALGVLLIAFVVAVVRIFWELRKRDELNYALRQMEAHFKILQDYHDQEVSRLRRELDEAVQTLLSLR